MTSPHPEARLGDMLAFIANVDARHSLRLTAEGDLALVRRPHRHRSSRETPVAVLAITEATRLNALQLGRKVTNDPRKWPKAFNGAVARKLGDTPAETLDKLAAHYAAT